MSVPSAQRLTTNIQYNQLPEKSINIKQDTIRDGFDIISENYTQKIITANGWLISDSGAGLKTLIDNFKNNLRPKEGNLDIETHGGSGVYTRWVATVRNILIPEEHYQIVQKPWNCEFLCQPFGHKITAEAAITLGTTEGSDFTNTILEADFVGTYHAEPTITFDIHDGNNLNFIKLENEDNDDWIQVAGTHAGKYADNEQLIINCENETVELDGAPVDFTGIFPRLDASSNNELKITLDKSGTVSVSASLVYVATYL